MEILVKFIVAQNHGLNKEKTCFHTILLVRDKWRCVQYDLYLPVFKLFKITDIEII